MTASKSVGVCWLLAFSLPHSHISISFLDSLLLFLKSHYSPLSTLFHFQSSYSILIFPFSHFRYIPSSYFIVSVIWPPFSHSPLVKYVPVPFSIFWVTLFHHSKCIISFPFSRSHYIIPFPFSHFHYLQVGCDSGVWCEGWEGCTGDGWQPGSEDLCCGHYLPPVWQLSQAQSGRWIVACIQS